MTEVAAPLTEPGRTIPSLSVAVALLVLVLAAGVLAFGLLS
jgi:hypothetical protein